MKFKAQILLGIILLTIGVNSGLASVHADETSQVQALPQLLSKLAADYEQEVQNLVQPQTNNTVAEGERFVKLLPSTDTFVGNDNVSDWQNYCNQLGLSVDDYQRLLKQENDLLQSIPVDLQAAKDADDVFASYRDVENVVSSVLDYIHNKKLLLKQFSQQLAQVDASQHVDGLVRLGDAMLTSEAKTALQNHDDSFAGTTLSSRHQYQLAGLLDAIKPVIPAPKSNSDNKQPAADNSDNDIANKDAEEKHDQPSVPADKPLDADKKVVPDKDDSQPVVPQPDNSKFTKQIAQQQAQINTLQATVVDLNQQLNALRATIKKIQNDGFGPIVYDQTGLITPAEREALDQLMDVIRQNTTGDVVNKPHPKHSLLMVKQHLKKVNRQLKHKHLCHRMRAKLLKLRRQLLKQLRHK